MQIQEENEKYAALQQKMYTEYANPDAPYSSVLLCDRAPIDAVAYTHYRVTHGEGYPWAKNFAHFLYDWVRESLKPYDIVFYIPIAFPLTANGVRPGDQDFQENIDELMQQIYIRGVLEGRPLDDMNKLIRHMVILSGAVDRRVSLAKKHIDDIRAESVKNIAPVRAFQLPRTMQEYATPPWGTTCIKG
jgi:hypothetical protein